MDVSSTIFQPIFEGVKQYVVPLFQRSYSWGKKEWMILWTDIKELYDSENPRQHFMGSLVTIPAKSVPEGVAKFSLIDGQQRITTLYLILMAMGDLYKESGQIEKYEEIKNIYLVNPYKKGNDYYKILPTQIDRDVFKSISSNPEVKIEHEMWNAYNFFRKKMALNIDLDRMKNIITTKLSIVSIVLDSSDNPYLVFESLNHKGKPLSVADLIRNYVFMSIHIEKQEEVYREKWKPMQDRLGESIPEFVRHYLMMGGEYINTGDVYNVLKEQIDNEGAEEYLERLCIYSEMYDIFLHPEKEDNIEIRNELIVLKELDISTSYPLLLNLYSLYKQKIIEAKELVQMLFVIENYIIRRFVCGVPSNQLNKIFPPIFSQMQKIEEDSYLLKLKKALQAKNYPKDYDFRECLKTAKLYGNGDRVKKTKIILERIEQSFKHKEISSLDNMTIEHVMPQTLSDEWKIHLGDDCEQTHELYLNTLGNLTLTAYNSELSNDSFKRKREIYNESHLEMNKYFSTVEKWSDIEIKQRAGILASKLMKIYPYFGETINSSDLSSVTGTKPYSLVVLGQEFNVKTWADVLMYTLKVVSDLAPDKLENIETDYPSLVGKNAKIFRRPKELCNEYYYESNLSASHIYNFCKQLVNVMELSEDEWKTEVTN